MKNKCTLTLILKLYLLLLTGGFIFSPVAAQQYLNTAIASQASYHFSGVANHRPEVSYSANTNTVSSGISSADNIANVAFDKIEMPNTTGQYTSLTIGPDGKLYALSNDGIIKRFMIDGDGTLTAGDTLYSLEDEYGVRSQKLSIGFAFDPSSTAEKLIAWVTHTSFKFTNGSPWDGKLSRLSGDNLQVVQDVLINLPRSTKDHLTNSIAFGPDGNLYFTQGSISTMGGADPVWGNRNESLLSGAVLKLDLTKLITLPLDVKTVDGGGTYNPYAANAPLTIYASGLRNAYDLVWHSNGNLYIPTNGSSPGGNTPASVKGTLRMDGSMYNGPVIPALTSVQQTMEDFLFKIVKGGYYGHPNPRRGEYVMNGGNPTKFTDPAQVDNYPVGTRPDINWRGYAYDFQAKKSPDGIIEYKSNTFNGALKGKLLVAEYSRGDDIIVLTPGGPDNNIIDAVPGDSIKGFSGFLDPLDLTEDLKTGNIYVSEYRAPGKIVLLRAKDTLKRFSDKPELYPNPPDKKLNIKFPRQYQGGFSLQIIDLSGRVYEIGKTIITAGGSNKEINISNLLLNGGEYFLRICSDAGKTDIIKFMIK